MSKNKKEVICGIYGFRAIVPESSCYGFWYIGQSVNISKRGYGHWNRLKRECHHNVKLQNYYNKYGKNGFKFFILIECEPNQLNYHEINLIKEYESFSKKGFNLTFGGDGGRNRRCRLQNMNTGKVVDYPSIYEFCKMENVSYTSMISNVLNGKSNYTGEWFNPNREWKPKSYQLIDPWGKNYTFYKLGKFCNKYNLDKGSVCALINKKNLQHKGWKAVNGREKHNYYRLEYSFLSPSGQIFKGENVNEFAKKMNLDAGQLREVLNGNMKYSKGWRKYKDGDEITKFDFKIYEYKFISPNGKLYEFDNLGKFARENGICHKNLQAVYKERKNHYKGWRKFKEGDKQIPFQMYKYIFISPENETFESNKFNEFAKQHNLNRVCLERVINKENKSHKGWKVKKIYYACC